MLDESVKIVLEALYLESDIIKRYVDAVVQGNRAPYTILAKSTDSIKNDEIITRLRDRLNELTEMLEQPHASNIESDIELIKEMLDEDMVLEEDESYMILMEDKDGNPVPNTNQIVSPDRISGLKLYAESKGWKLQVKKYIP